MKSFRIIASLILPLLQWGLMSSALADHGRSAANAFFSSSPSILSQDDCFDFYYKEYRGAPPANAPPGAHTGGYYMPFHPDLGKYASRLDCVRFTYKVNDAVVEGHMIKPKYTSGGKLPVVIYNRGGNDQIGLTQAETLEAIHMKLADQGFVVLSSQYRGARVWPANVTFNIGKDEFGGKDVDDVRALFPIIDGMPEADQVQIGMYGFSRGGMMTYLAARNDKQKRIKAMVVVAGLTDALAPLSQRADMEREVYGRLIPNFATNREQALKERSVIYWLDELTDAPLLLLHSENDDRVNVYNAIILDKKLKELGRTNCKLITFKNAEHNLRGIADTADQKIFSWFKDNLRTPSHIASLSSR